MKFICPICKDQSRSRRTIVRSGRFYRKSDSRKIQRFHCLTCKKGFSTSTYHRCYRQNKRHKNDPLRKLLFSGVSLRQSARILNIDRTTVARKLIFLGLKSKTNFNFNNLKYPKADSIQFDDLETFEHTKCKPLSVTLAVESKTRRILGFEVSKMPAKGLLVKKALKKYGYRNDERSFHRKTLFTNLKPLVHEFAEIKSDSNPHYFKDVKKYFPKANYAVVLGKRGAITGQGELKKTKLDPLFSLNHTCAMFRAHMSRLIRKTWNTTKKQESLVHHISIYAHYHNERLNLE